MDVYGWIPYLAILEKRKDLLPADPTKLDETTKKTVRDHLRSILFGKPVVSPVPPRVFFYEANVVAFSPSPFHAERFARYYALLSLGAFREGHPLLEKHYPPRDSLPVPELLSIPRPFGEVKLYHLEVSGGTAFLGKRSPYLQASLLYRDILSWIEKKVRSLVESGALDDLRPFATEVLAPPGGRGRKRYSYIERIASASGIPDGRKRILFYWLIPYWVTVEGRSPEEVLDLANEWISRQGGTKIYSSWILSEAENVRSKGIKPWSLSKVERIDPELVKLLRGLKVL